jgi:hypothetical protein
MKRLVGACVAAVLLAGCGSSSLEEGEANSLKADQLTLKDDVGAIQAIDGDKAEAKRLVDSIAKTIVLYDRFQKAGEKIGGANGAAFTQGAGEKALDLIARDVPSIVIGREPSPTGLDSAAAKNYIRYAVSDPRRALRGPVTDHVRSMLNDVEDASPDTKVPTLNNETVKQVLNATASSLRPYYPDQAARLRAKADGQR